MILISPNSSGRVFFIITVIVLKKPVEVRKKDPAGEFLGSVGCCHGGDLEEGYLFSDEIGSHGSEPMHSTS